MLAVRLGFQGYENIRSLYADGLRRRTDDFSERADNLVESYQASGHVALAMTLLDTLAIQVESLRDAHTLESLASAAADIANARRVYVLGQRARYAVGYQFAYSCGLIG